MLRWLRRVSYRLLSIWISSNGSQFFSLAESATLWELFWKPFKVKLRFGGKNIYLVDNELSLADLVLVMDLISTLFHSLKDTLNFKGFKNISYVTEVSFEKQDPNNSSEFVCLRWNWRLWSDNKISKTGSIL